MNDGDRLRRKLGIRIELLDRGIVPRLDFPKEDFRKRRPVEHDVTGLDAVDVDNGDDAAEHGRELNQAGLIEVFRLQRHVRGPESDGLGLDLLDSAAGADRLIVQPCARPFLIGVGPLGVDRIGERGASARNVGGLRRRYRSKRDRAGRMRER